MFNEPPIGYNGKKKVHALCAKEPDDQADDCNVICPYCLNSYQAEAEDYVEDEREETCFKCKRVFLLHDESTITHYTRAKP